MLLKETQRLVNDIHTVITTETATATTTKNEGKVCGKKTNKTTEKSKSAHKTQTSTSFYLSVSILSIMREHLTNTSK